jgi:hypothetical protein
MFYFCSDVKRRQWVSSIQFLPVRACELLCSDGKRLHLGGNVAWGLM